MNKPNYFAPEMELLNVVIESGYEMSIQDGDSMDYGDGGEGTPLD